MNSKWHLYISIFKSFLRILGCVLSIALSNWLVLAISFLIAEILGVLEELKDDR